MLLQQANQRNQDAIRITNREQNARVISQNKQKMNLGLVEILYFGFFCFEPTIWPDKQPPATCQLPFTTLSILYTSMILVCMLPLRVYLNSKASQSPREVNKTYGIITFVHMLLCLGWIIYALVELTYSEPSCWSPFTWQYLNYYLILLIVLGPAMTLALALSLLILCLPCVAKQLISLWRDERARAEMGERVVQGLAQRTFNPQQFKAQKECAICLTEFTTEDRVTPLSCDIKHYFHSSCIEQWIKTNPNCPLCRVAINEKDLKSFNAQIDRLLEQ